MGNSPSSEPKINQDKDFKNMYGNVNDHKMLELKKKLISHAIDKNRSLPKRYKLYLKKYYKII